MNTQNYGILQRNWSPKSNSKRSFISISNKAMKTEGWFNNSLEDIVKVWVENLSSCKDVFEEITKRKSIKK